MASFTYLAGSDFVASLSSKEACLADELVQRQLELIGDKLVQHAATSNSDNATALNYAAAIAYYLSGFYARAYVILSSTAQQPPPQSAFKLLRQFFLKEFLQLELDARAAISHPDNSDHSLADGLETGTMVVREAIERIIITELGRSLATAWQYACDGSLNSLDMAIGRLDVMRQVAQDSRVGVEEGYQWVLCGASVLLKEFRKNALRTHFDVAGMLGEPGPAGEVAENYVQSAARRSAPLVELWRSQTIALPKINEVSERGRPSFLLKAPTSAGKTNIAEIAIVRFLMDAAAAGDDEKKCLYIAPFRALASEVERKLRKHLKPLNVWVAELYGGSEISPADRMQFQTARVLVATPEKVEALLRYVPEFANQIGLIIVDEGHVIDAGERGLRFELLLQRLVRRFGERGTRLVFVSAVIGNADQLSQWITGKNAAEGVVSSDYRPTTNYLGLLKWNGAKAQQQLTYSLDGKHPNYQPHTSPPTDIAEAMPNLGRKCFPRANNDNEAVALAALRLARNGVTLVFSPKPDSCEGIAKGALVALEYAKDCQKQGVEIEPLSLKIPKLGSISYERWKRCERLARGIVGKDALVTRALEAGIVMHHGGLPEKLRDEFAILLQEGDLPLVVATSTVIHGVNSPVQTILARSLVRGAKNDPKKRISPTEFFNLAGRAGRAMKERDGALLLFAKPDKEASARAQIKQYVDQQTHLVLQSQLRRFLQIIANQWRAKHLGASVETLCVQLAEGNVNWLTPLEIQWLSQIDTSLIAAIEEQHIDIDLETNAIQHILERSLLSLQCPPGSQEYKTSIGILAARIEHLARLPSEERHRFYRSGLSLSDYQALDARRDEIIVLLTQLSKFDNWTDVERVEFVCTLHQNVLSKLPILKAMDTDKGIPWPPYIHAVIKEWLLGKEEEIIAKLPVIQAVEANQAQVINALDKLRGYKLPMALNALRAYVDAVPVVVPSDIPSEPNWLVSRHLIESALGTCAAMINHGVPSTTAALFMGLGLESRSAAIACAQRYTNECTQQAIYEWIASLDSLAIGSWGLDRQTLEDLGAFQDLVRDGLSILSTVPK
jgi:hypothetical protein